jgi:hypothetical protein
MPRPAARPKLDATSLDEADGLGDAPPEAKDLLASLARVETLAANQATSGFALGLLLDGDATVWTAADARITNAATGAVISSTGTLRDAVGLQIVAGTSGARVALWEREAIEEALRACPWVLEELAGAADRMLALAGGTTGDLGALDPGERGRLFEILAVVVARPGETVTSDAAPVAAICAGSVQVAEGDEGVTVGAGSVLFPRAEAQRALVGTDGAILLVGDASALAQVAAASSALAALFRQS